MANAYMYKYVYSPAEGSGDIDTSYCFRFYRQADATHPFDPETEFFFDPNDSRITNYMGASQFQLEYNANNSSLFQFTYLHTPFYSGAQEAVDFYFCGYAYNNIFTYINTMTGCFFTKLEPASFWEDILGFDLSTIVIQDSPQKILSSPLQVGVNITGNLVSYDALFDKANAPRMYSADGEAARRVEAVSTQSQAIVAKKSQGISTSSFYIIELGGLSEINMTNDYSFYRTICSFGSKEYSSQGVISIYPDGSSFYTNTGIDPIVVSSLRVRILDNLTKQPSNTLGTKNTIFIELTNPPPEVIQRPIPPPRKSKEKKKSEK